MARKSSKKKSNSPPKRAGKRPPAKVAARKAAKPGRRKSAAAPAANPAAISTGSGPSAAEIGASLVELFNAGKWEEPCRLWWSPDIVSVEGMGMAWSGRKAVEAKNEEWGKQNTVHGGSAEGPFVGASGFAVKFRMEVEEKATGKRVRMEEVGVYTVRSGKIVREEFMYGPMTEQRVLD